ncbi:MAG: hypothetical protein ACAH21_07760 [Ramlibacter sp.]
MFRRGLFLSIFISFLAGCDSGESRRIEETRTKLVGSWLEEVQDAQYRYRRIVALGADGKFTDRILSTRGAVTERREFAGEWSYDGTNFKRRYLQENGRQYAGGTMRFTTFPLLSVGPSELVVTDTMASQQVTFRRVADGTQP